MCRDRRRKAGSAFSRSSSAPPWSRKSSPLAARWRVSLSRVAQMRSTGIGLRCYKPTFHRIRYPVPAVLAYEKRTRAQPWLHSPAFKDASKRNFKHGEYSCDVSDPLDIPEDDDARQLITASDHLKTYGESDGSRSWHFRDK